MRTSSRAIATSLLSFVLALPSVAWAQSNRGGGEPRLLTNHTAAIQEGGSSWIALNWRGGDSDATDFAVTATVNGRNRGVTVSYPDDHSGASRSFTSLMTDDVLSASETDFTALHLDVPYGANGNLTLKLDATYTLQGHRRHRSFEVKVPVVRYRGNDLEQVTSDVGSVTAGTSRWVGVDLTGMAPRLDNVRLVVTDPAGLAVTYPAYGTSTGLAADAVLDAGETDVARFLVDAAGVTAGGRSLSFTVTYDKGTQAGTYHGTVTVDVTAP